MKNNNNSNNNNNEMRIEYARYDTFQRFIVNLIWNKKKPFIR